MNKLKVAAEIFGKSFLLIAIALTAIVAAAYAQDSFHENGLTIKTIALGLIAISLFLIALFSHHYLVCIPSQKVCCTIPVPEREK